MSVILELVNLGPLSRFDHVMGTRTYELYLRNIRIFDREWRLLG